MSRVPVSPRNTLANISQLTQSNLTQNCNIYFGLAFYLLIEEQTDQTFLPQEILDSWAVQILTLTRRKKSQN